MNPESSQPAMPARITREEELLLSCLLLRPDDRERLRLLSALDWEKVFEQSGKHGISPLLYYKLKTLNSGWDISDKIIRKLQREYLNSSARSLCQSTELSRIIGAFQDDGISVIVLKGAYLAEVVYGNPALRLMDDIDLLIHKADMPRAEKLLLGLGYSYRGDPEMDRATRANLGFYSTRGKVIIELHWHLIVPSSSLTLDIGDIWRNARSATVADASVLVLSIEDLLLYQCYHTAKHMFCHYGLRSLYDIVEIISFYRSQINWKTIIRRARDWNVVNSVFLTLLLTREILDVAIEDSVIDSLRPENYSQNISNCAVELIFLEGERPPAVLSENIGKLWDMRRFRDRVALILRRIFPSRKEMGWMYRVSPHSLFIYIFYPYRIIELLIRHYRTIILMLRRNRKMTTYAEYQKKQLDLRDWLGLYEQ